ncbi:MAG: hypothetical protein ACIAXF_05660, partial [Phycisphaerales bacterium JB063]
MAEKRLFFALPIAFCFALVILVLAIREVGSSDGGVSEPVGVETGSQDGNPAVVEDRAGGAESGLPDDYGAASFSPPLPSLPPFDAESKRRGGWDAVGSDELHDIIDRIPILYDDSISERIDVGSIEALKSRLYDEILAAHSNDPSAIARVLLSGDYTFDPDKLEHFRSYDLSFLENNDVDGI